ncbi:MAG: UvrD-helicase domain-containing protein [Planctomycetota bacterium]|nr:UvrD-helicase domain-containing protein [Planctomycetota bacterium]
MSITATKSPHQLILASAGTGKTFALTNHYVGLVLSGVAPERILATTFTRKAAGEILGRILERLAEAVESDEKRAELTACLPQVNTDRAHILACLAQLTRNLDRFQVCTLDAFFAHLGTLFALDLELPAGWTILDERDAREQYAEAIARLLERAEGGEWVELLRHLQRAASRRTFDAMLATVGDVRSLWLESGPEPWAWLKMPEAPAAAELADAVERMASAPAPLTKAGKPNKKWLNGFDPMMENVRAGNWLALLKAGPTKALIEGQSTYSSVDIPDEVVAGWEVVKRQAAHVLIGEIVRQNAATVRFMGDFEDLLTTLRSEQGGLRFEDLPRALAPAAHSDSKAAANSDQDGEEHRASGASGPLASRGLNMWYRLDGRLDHLLLDEFQDTSPLQWRVLARLAEEIIASGETDAQGAALRSFFCVGDVKQSIYGWRGAEPGLLEGLGGTDGHFPGLEETHLDLSYRSSDLILDTVNRVFAGLEDCPAFGDGGPAQWAANKWQAAFNPHSSAKTLPGSATLFEAPHHEEHSQAVAAVLDLAVERVATIVAEEPQASVALLLRRRAHIAPLIHRLAALGIRASDQGGNPLTDSEAVVQFLSLLHLADHPADSMAAFHLASSPLGPALGLTPENMKETAGTVAAHIRKRLLAEGLGAFTASFTNVIRKSADTFGDWDRRRFGQLVDLAQAFAPRNGLRSTPFVEHVRQTNVEDTSAARVKVMTIHGAKGLEFDAVVLPELDNNLILQQPRFLAERPDVFGPLAATTHSPKQVICRLDDELLAIRHEREQLEIRESLCLLYVAMTRAIFRLEMVVRGANKSRKNSTGRWSSLLCHALGSEADDDGLLWSHEDNATPWRLSPAREEGDAPAPRPPVPPFRLASHAGPRSLPRRAPSAAEGGGALCAADLLSPASASARDLGTLVHRLLEEVHWLEDLAATDQALAELLEPLSPDRDLRAQALALFRSALEDDEVRRALSKPDAATDEVSVANEFPFAVRLEDPDGAPYLMNGTIDRLVVFRANGSPRRAEIIDHKTDTAASADELAARVEHHRPQLEAYRAAAAQFLGLEREAITCRLLFLRPGRVVTL